jgi:hypothetical protein
MKLTSLLLDKGLLTAAAKAKVDSAVAAKRPLDQALSEQGITLKDALNAAGETYGIPARILGDPPADEAALAYIPVDSAKHYGIAPLDTADGVLEVGIIDPDNIEAMDALQFISSKIGMPYKLFLISESDFARILDAYQNITGEVGRALSEYETTNSTAAAAVQK